LFDSSRFLEVANKLLADNTYRNEPGWRTAIGRAYYAAFLAAKKKLEQRGCSFLNVDRIHQEVIQELMSRRSDTANKLNTLREKRVDSDYRMDAVINQGLGQKCAKLSQLVIDDLRSV